MQKTKIFCLPYAGGSAMVFNKWKAFLSSRMELVPIELAGRGSRIREPYYNTVEEAVNDIFLQIKPALTLGPYALFGHSMGAMLTYELAQKIIAEGLIKPVHIFFSGRGAPHHKISEHKKYHLLDEVNFKDKVMGLGGTPAEVFESKELSDLFIPLLRNDFRLATTDHSERKIKPFDFNITVMVGKDEDISAEAIGAWKEHTRKLCSIHYFNGGHFFLNQEAAGLVSIINNTCQ